LGRLDYCGLPEFTIPVAQERSVSEEVALTGRRLESCRGYEEQIRDRSGTAAASRGCPRSAPRVFLLIRR
jgi:hypothetical protein